MKEIGVDLGCGVQRTSSCTNTRHSLCRDFIVVVAAIDRYVCVFSTSLTFT